MSVIEHLFMCFLDVCMQRTKILIINLILDLPVLHLVDFVGGSLFGLLSKNTRFGRNPVVLLGVLVHFLAFYLIFLNMPGDAPIAPVEGTDSSAYIKPRYSDCPFPGT